MSTQDTRAHKHIDGELEGISRRQFMRALLTDLRALERMLALFHALVAATEGLEQSLAVAHADLAAGVAQLVGLRLLRRVLPASAKAASDAVRAGAETYSCGALTWEAADKVAKNIKIELGMYLHDS